jgi:hypothetical protein
VAISNHRLISLQHGEVQFNYRDYADGNRSKTLILTAFEFMRRFLLHVLPKRFVRIRHYGLPAATNVNSKLVTVRDLLGAPTQPQPDDGTDSAVPWWLRLLRLTGIDFMLCPYCRQGRLIRTQLTRTCGSDAPRP